MAAFMALGESHIFLGHMVTQHLPTSPRPKIYEGTVKGLPYIGQGLQPLMRHFGGLAAGRHRICEAAGRWRLHVLGGKSRHEMETAHFSKKTTSEHPKLNTLWKNTTGKSPSCCIVAGEKESQVNDHYP